MGRDKRKHWWEGSRLGAWMRTGKGGGWEGVRDGDEELEWRMGNGVRIQKMRREGSHPQPTCS